MKLTENDPLGRRRVLNLLFKNCELGARLVPVRTLIAAKDGLTLHGTNINLRVKGELTKTHEQDEHLLRVVMLNVLPAGGDLALDATIEVALFLRGKVEGLLGNNRSRRKLGERRTHLLHRAVKTGLRHDVEAVDRIIEPRLLEADQAKEIVHILDLIHDGCRRDRPKRLPLHLGDRLEEHGAFVADAVSLVKDDTIPLPIEANIHFLIVGDEEPGRLELRPARQLPAAVLHQHDVEVRLGGRVDPLTDHGLRTEQKRLLWRVLYQAEHLHGLAQPHLVAEKAT